MKLNDATRYFGGVGILLPLFLILLISSVAAYACPGSGTKVVYRTKAAKSVPLMGSTLITYRGPASTVRCGNNVIAAKNVRYVKVRNSGPRYVAVRAVNVSRPVDRRQYVAVRSVDQIDDSRYLVVRRAPAYVNMGTRYVVVRDQAPRTRYVAVRDIDDDDIDSSRSVALRRIVVDHDVPRTRYVAVRSVSDEYDLSPARYVAVRNVQNACACPIGLQSSLDEVETVRPRHVVVKSDLLAGTEEVIVPPSSYDDTAYVAPAMKTVVTAENVNYVPATYVVDSDENVIPVSNVEVSANNVAYLPAYDESDLDDQAILDTGGTTYVAADDIEDACLSPVAVQASPVTMHTAALNYVPIDDIDDDASLGWSEPMYIATNDTASTIEYVPVVADDDDLDLEGGTTYVVADDMEDSCSCPVEVGTLDDGLNAETVSFIPVDRLEDIDTETANFIPAESVNYVPVDDMEDTEVVPVSYMPAESVDHAAAASIAASEVALHTAEVDGEPADMSDPSTVLVADVGVPPAAGLPGSTEQIAGNIGYRDGFDDGQDAALEADAYHPENSGDYQKATNGYEDTYGDKDVYKDAYRSSYLQGYSAGFNSVHGAG